MKITTNRLEAFSDGVVAIVITIMVLELKLPELNEENTAYEIRHHIKEIIPYFGTYAFSFMMIGILWTNHHHMFHLLQHTDEKLLWQNFLFLFFLSLIPFGTGMLGSSITTPLSIAIYGGVLFFTSVALLSMRIYSLNQHLLHKDRDPQLTRIVNYVSKRGKHKAILGAICYALSIPLAWVSIYISYILLVVPAIIFFTPDGIDNEELAEKVAEKNS